MKMNGVAVVMATMVMIGSVLQSAHAAQVSAPSPTPGPRSDATCLTDPQLQAPLDDVYATLQYISLNGFPCCQYEATASCSMLNFVPLGHAAVYLCAPFNFCIVCSDLAQELFQMVEQCTTQSSTEVAGVYTNADNLYSSFIIGYNLTSLSPAPAPAPSSG